MKRYDIDRARDLGTLSERRMLYNKTILTRRKI